LGFLEEFRDLALHEWNFKVILEQKLISLLRQQKIYWKQRGTIRWVTKGDAGTKFFHANATIKHRKNLITCLENSAGTMLTSHQDKAHTLWGAYKERLGKYEVISMQLNLDEILSSHPNLSSLEDPFTSEEINQVVASLPTDKSPGPDGFNTNFIKKCWPIIKKIFTIFVRNFIRGMFVFKV